MSEQSFATTALTCTLDNELLWAEALFFPEASVLAPRRPRLMLTLGRHVREALSRTPAGAVYRRRGAGEPSLFELKVTIDPPRPGDDDSPTHAAPREAWGRAVELTFHAVRWRHGESASIAYVPALGIEVIAANDEELAARLPEHVRFALLRRGAGKSLRELAELQRFVSAELKPLDVTVALKTPKRAAIDAAKDPEEKPVIDEVGFDLAGQTLTRAWELDAGVASLADALTGRNPRSVLLVGKSGVGKTSTLHELVRRRAEFGLSQTPFWSTSGSRLVAGMSGFGMWQERCQRLCREAAKARAVLYLGDLVELMEVGRSTHNAQGIASFLRPYLGRGEVLAVAECTPDQLAVIERTDPHLVEVFTQLKIEEPTQETTRAILRSELLASGGAMEEAALESVEALHRRYATYSAFPARPVRFVRNLLRDRAATPGPAIGRRDVLAAFARETGLPLALLDESEPLDLPETGRWFASRVIGQAGAVDLVVDLIATVKAAMNRPRRPIASLLFIGPTGVGKTEMAKSLAEFFFGDKERLARFDMSEYASPAAVERLVGGGYQSEGLLTARVREQPFSVVLLDEFEKAHPAFFDLMLQVLGEGRLTDASGRVADFGNAIVVMTSNLGAASFRQSSFGLKKRGDDAADADRHFVDAVRDHFRPEMFNRIDRVVPFAALGEAQVLQIARREVELVRGRDGLRQRGVALEVSEEAVRHLAAAGFDARYGARPLKRTIERELLVPLAEGLNDYAEDARLTARADVRGGRVVVSVRAAETRATGSPSGGSAAHWTDLRRQFQRLNAGPVVTAMRNELYALHRLKERLEAFEAARVKAKRKLAEKTKVFVRVADDKRLAAMPRLTELTQAIDVFGERVTGGEDEALLGEAPPAADRLAATDVAWRELLLSVYSLRFNRPDEAVLAFFGQPVAQVYDLARAYHDLVAARGATVALYTFERTDRATWKKADKPEYHAMALNTARQSTADFFTERAPAVGVGLVIRGPHVHALLAGEGGLHLFRDQGQVAAKVRVDVGAESLAQFAVPDEAERPDLWDVVTARRTFDLDKSLMYDVPLDEGFRWTGRLWQRTVADAVAWRLEQATALLVLGVPS